MDRKHPPVSVIAALSANGVIGNKGTLPWRLPADLRYFRNVTTGHTVVMGRKNYEDIGRPLPNRTNIVVTRDRGFHAEGCLVAHSIADALELAGDEEVFFIGGAQLYEQVLPLANRLYLTWVHAHIDGDTRFPEWVPEEWRRASHEFRPADADNPYDMSFEIFERSNPDRQGAK